MRQGVNVLLFIIVCVTPSVVAVDQQALNVYRIEEKKRQIIYSSITEG